jgi:hypothetical protein
LLLFLPSIALFLKLSSPTTTAQRTIQRPAIFDSSHKRETKSLSHSQKPPFPEPKFVLLSHCVRVFPSLSETKPKCLFFPSRLLQQQQENLQLLPPQNTKIDAALLFT